MKNKNVKTLLAVVLMGATAFAGAFALAGCAKQSGNKGDNSVDIDDGNVPLAPACTHVNPEHHSAKDATCTENGNKEYWYCGDCSTYFADEACTTETTAVLVTIRAGHSYGDLIPAKDGGCTLVSTVAHYHCDVCGENFDEDKKVLNVIDTPAPGHNYGEWIAEKPATCEVEGEVGHYHCSECGANFDRNKYEIEDISIAVTEHDYVAEYNFSTGKYELTCKNDSSHVTEIDAGTEEYPILVNSTASLIAAVEKGGYIKFVEDVKDAATVNIEKDVVIDLNGKTLSNYNTYYNVINVVEGSNANVTVKNGTIKNEYKGSNPSYGICGENASSLTLVDLTVETVSGKSVRVTANVNYSAENCTLGEVVTIA